MRSVTSATQAHLDGDTTSLAMIWRIRLNKWQPQITGVTSAGVVSTLTPHHLAKGDCGFVSGVFGATTLNDNYWEVVSVLGTHAVQVNSSVTGAYTSGGVLHKTLGFTDHDNNITLDNLVFHATDGMTASKVQMKEGGITNLDITSLFDTGRVTANDILAGLYDDARVDVVVVNYEDTTQQISITNGYLGEIQLNDVAYTAEVRDYVHRLKNMHGDVFSKHCRAELGDTRCGVNTASAVYQQAMVVTSANTQSTFDVAGINSVSSVSDTVTFQSSLFKYGTVLWYSGDNAGYGMEIANTSATVSVAVSAKVVLLARMPSVPQVGDVFVAVMGCDKQFSTCKDRFSNAVNFRGEPYVPLSNEVHKYGRNI